jgi:hypothetical protein
MHQVILVEQSNSSNAGYGRRSGRHYKKIGKGLNPAMEALVANKVARYVQEIRGVQKQIY